MTTISRRHFLAASAAATAPLILPARVWGANDQIALGCIGTGGMGRHVMGAMDHSGEVRVVAVCDVDAHHRQEAADMLEYEVDQYGDYRRLLERDDVDAVLISTPDHWHAVQTVHACQAGKDVYVEKPACNTVSEGHAMKEAIRRYDRIVQVGSQGRSMDAFYPICNYIRNGELGEVTRVDCWHYENRSGGDAPDQDPPDHLDWDMWLGPARWVPYNPDRCHFTFRWFMEYGGGNVRDRGAHVLSLVQWFLDFDDRGPTRVTATGTPPLEGNFNCPTEMDVTWEFEDPELTITWRQPGDPPEHVDHGFGAVYHGSEGSLTVTGGDGGGGSADGDVAQYEPPADGERVFQSPGHHQNWFDCIRSREQPIMHIEAGHRVAVLCILANLAYQLGRPLEWDPENERVVGDEEANRLLHEPGRGPWHV